MRGLLRGQVATLRLIEQRGEVTNQDCAAFFGVKRGAAESRMNLLKRRGLLSVQGAGCDHFPYRFRLSEAGRTVLERAVSS